MQNHSYRIETVVCTLSLFFCLGDMRAESEAVDPPLGLAVLAPQTEQYGLIEFSIAPPRSTRIRLIQGRWI